MPFWTGYASHAGMNLLSVVKGRWGVCEEGVELSGHVALEAADDLSLGESFLGAALDVVTGAGVGDHAHHHDAPERLVGSAVAATVESFADDEPGGGVDGRAPAQVGARR